MKTATLGVTARHTHLLRAAQGAREAFACSLCNEPGTVPSRSLASMTVWLGIVAMAGLALYVAY